jgi:hypothetical protein
VAKGERRVATVPSNREDIIAEIKAHIGKLGGGFGD